MVTFPSLSLLGHSDLLARQKKQKHMLHAFLGVLLAVIVLLNYAGDSRVAMKLHVNNKSSRCCVKLNGNTFHIVEFSALTDWILSSVDSPRLVRTYLNSTVGCCCSFPIALCPTRRPTKKSYCFFLFGFPHPPCISFLSSCHRLLASCPAV